VTSMEQTAARSPAVVRAVRILEAVGNQPGITVSELSRTLGAPKSSTSNLCHDLVAVGALSRDGAGFSLTGWVLGLASSYLRSSGLVDAFHRAVRSMPHALAETIQLARFDGAEMVYLARHDGSHPVRLVSEIGRQLPASCTGTGKAVLAGLDEADVAALFPNGLPQLTRHSHQSLETLLDDLREVRQRGYATDEEEAAEGVVCVAAPVREFAAATPMAAVSISFLKARATPALRKELADVVTRLTERMSHALSGPIPTEEQSR
jgi:IclR family transcriptional regulator, blcABC operon repressor